MQDLKGHTEEGAAPTTVYHQSPFPQQSKEQKAKICLSFLTAGAQKREPTRITGTYTAERARREFLQSGELGLTWT